MRLTPLKIGNVVEAEAYHQISPELAARQACAWHLEFALKLRKQGLGTSFAERDRLSPEQRAAFDTIYEQGIDNVTRRKLGYTELE
jgi:hypothetical protein